MKLIAILLSLLIEYFSGGLHDWRKTEWVSAFNKRIYALFEGKSFRDGPVGVLLVVGIPALLTWLAWAILANTGWLLGFLFGLAVFLYCIGPSDPAREVEQYLEAARRGDSEAAFEYAVQLVGDDAPREPLQLAGSVKAAVFVALNERLLSVIFWFLILGPVGAVIYRVARLNRAEAGGYHGGYVSASNELMRILNWPGTRLSIVAFALAGNFVDTMMKVKSLDSFLRGDNDELMVAAAEGAMNNDESMDEHEVLLDGIASALALAKRSFLVWIAAIAAFTIAGWIV